MRVVSRLLAGVLPLIQTLGCSEGGTTSRLEYPPARTVDVVDDYHGTKVADPYRWLEDVETKEVQDWAAAQTALAVPLLRENDVRPWLLARVAELRKAQQEPASGPDEPPLIDESALGEGKSIDDIWRSPDGKLAAYTVSDRGSEWVEMRIRRLSDGKDLDERMDGLLWTTAVWTADSRGFFYVRSRKPEGRLLTLMKGPALYYHVAGTPQSADVALYATPPETTDLVLEARMSDDGRYLFLDEGNGAHVEEIGWLLSRMSVLDLGDPRRPKLTNPLVPLTPERDAAYRVLDTKGDTLFVFTDKGAPRRRVVAFSVRNPAPASWRDVVPQGDGVIDVVHVLGDYFVVVYLKDLQHGVRVFDRNGTMVRELTIAPMSTVVNARRGSADHELIVETMDGGWAPARRRHDLRTGAITVEREPKLPYTPGEYETKLVWYPSKDGVQVPMHVLHKSGITLDGSHPTLLIGYGASSQQTLPWFGDWAQVTLELGMVLAQPALRGGGELGREWYEAAIMERKQKTFDDFIAAAEHLIKEGYTSPEKLAIQGASNGGLLVTAVISQRPDLFRAAVAEVPQTDNLRYDRGRHAAQFGDPKNPAHFPFLYAYSPVHQVKPGTCYPATLITTALNDDRAPAWMSLKYTATLQAAQGCERPIVLRADTGGGHGGSDADGAAADLTAFVASQLGVKAPRAQTR